MELSDNSIYDNTSTVNPHPPILILHAFNEWDDCFKLKIFRFFNETENYNFLTWKISVWITQKIGKKKKEERKPYWKN